ncbi:hypothetical protein HOL34_00365 [bacterium]|jgi:uncharacterized membrane protein (Fun14 family)|nr:hypothetical protein [bacterium]MBT3903338.1 hypothetical protein [bacterium]MBT4578160.1 hypothetical protein [bacterium]MBT5345504.1 hypothetical protein [bacterium]MBT6131198.1 hypothetical protein [bacterium]
MESSKSVVTNSIRGAYDKVIEAARAHLNVEQVQEIALYAVISVIAGFLLKRMSSYIIFAVLGIAALLWVLHDIQVIVFNAEKVHSLVGVDATNYSTILHSGLAWVKAHVVLTVTSVISFVIGYKLG